MGKHDRIAVLRMPVLSFSSDLWKNVEEEKGRQTDRQTEEKRKERPGEGSDNGISKE